MTVNDFQNTKLSAAIEGDNIRSLPSKSFKSIFNSPALKQAFTQSRFQRKNPSVQLGNVHSKCNILKKGSGVNKDLHSHPKRM